MVPTSHQDITGAGTVSINACCFCSKKGPLTKIYLDGGEPGHGDMQVALAHPHCAWFRLWGPGATSIILGLTCTFLSRTPFEEFIYPLLALSVLALSWLVYNAGRDLQKTSRNSA